MIRTDYLLAELRCAAIRARLLASDFDAIGAALKGGLVTPDQALGLVADCDGFAMLEPTPPNPVEAMA
jgi:hypothetical protein